MDLSIKSWLAVFCIGLLFRLGWRFADECLRAVHLFSTALKQGFWKSRSRKRVLGTIGEPSPAAWGGVKGRSVFGGRAPRRNADIFTSDEGSDGEGASTFPEGIRRR